MQQVRALKSTRVIDGYRSIPNGVVVYANDKIIAVGPQSRTPIPPGATVTDYGPFTISPGLIEMHAHGCKGINANTNAEACLDFANFVGQRGTTTLLPTINRKISVVLDAIKQQEKEGYKGASMPYIHMEGPFLTPKNIKGYETADTYLLPPSIEKFEELWEESEGRIRMMGLGIELPGALELVRHMKTKPGLVVACAHTKTGYDEIMEAYENGVTHGTHIFNVMTGLHHRRPGTVGAILTTDGITTEVICDGFLVDLAAVDVAIRCKGIDNIAIITDLSMAGLSDGDYLRDDGRWITVENGVSYAKGVDRRKDNTMSGSSITQNIGVRNIHKRLGYPLEDAIRMATVTPARILGLQHKIGSLQVGMDADIIVFDEDLTMQEVIVKGTTIHQK
ncbi:N-acetylglucosamine-6-phosphate deacetylase [Eubacteriales bacterium OttesenSCG-928-M02]|nr:N-acetylglucosamine-6-phosphate deacetylase [Eubacteriales bacterium OttesenSCG-928-M02]